MLCGRNLTRSKAWLAAAMLLGLGGGMAQAKTVRVALNGYENNLTPFSLMFQSAPNVHDILNLVYDTLFWSQVKENPEPWLAESAEPSPDRKVWTVRLRRGVTWHDGKPFTAADVKFTFEYYVQYADQAGRHGHHVADAPPFERAEIVDDQTVRLVFKEPAPTFLQLPGADLPILPKHIWESITEPAKSTKSLPIGTGPFKMVEIVPDQLYRMAANESYFKGRPTIDELVVPIIKDPAAAFAALQAGQVDMVARNVPPELVEQFSSNKSLKLIKSSKFESIQVNFNTRKGDLANPKVRKAISLAIDSQALVKTVLLGHGLAGRDGFMHPGSPFALPGGSHGYDPKQATDLLVAAGFTQVDAEGFRSTADGRRMQVSILVSSFEPQSLRAVQLAAQQARAAGIKIIPEIVDPATMRQQRQASIAKAPSYDAYVSTYESHFHVDPDSLYYMFHSPGPKGFGVVITGYASPRFDAVAEQAAATLDMKARKEMLYDLQRILTDEMPMLVLYYPDGIFAYRPAAFDGWVADPGHGIFTKRSFLPIK